ncbi:hypothetical protein J6590_078355 [Homalodisca vitripennis]|nr:hypothetical protein J6590_078355 [Homalodisca vitripennis]
MSPAAIGFYKHSAYAIFILLAVRRSRPPRDPSLLTPGNSCAVKTHGSFQSLITLDLWKLLAFELQPGFHSSQLLKVPRFQKFYHIGTPNLAASRFQYLLVPNSFRSVVVSCFSRGSRPPAISNLLFMVADSSRILSG